MNVVRGAMSYRLNLEEKFVRYSRPTENYGVLTALPYFDSDWPVREMFPEREKEGAVPGEYDECGRPWLIAVEWAVTPVSLYSQFYLASNSHVS